MYIYEDFQEPLFTYDKNGFYFFVPMRLLDRMAKDFFEYPNIKYVPENDWKIEKGDD